MLQGMVISNLKMKDTQAYLSLVARFVAIINSWSVCDTFDFYGKQRFVGQEQEKGLAIFGRPDEIRQRI